MVKVTFLGTGGAVATANRDNTSLLLEIDSELVLFDCPGSLTTKILRAGYRPEKITAILITHIHPDHIYGWPFLVHSLRRERQSVRLFGSKETINFSRQLLDLFRLQDEKILFRSEPQVLFPGEEIELSAGIKITGYPVSHHSSSLAFKVTAPSISLVFSGDTAFDDSMVKAAQNSDCLIHDCSAPSRFFERVPFLAAYHTSSLMLGKLAERAGVKNLIPCHFFDDFGFSMEEIKEEIRKNFSGDLIIPEDGQSIILPPEKMAEGL
ncbi:MAG: MBL fold metallo-hydrolase [Candidatus Saccharicenans sp.]